MKKETVGFRMINWIKRKSIGCVLFVLILIYFLINSFFGIGYYQLALNDQFMAAIPVANERDEPDTPAVQEDVGLLDYIYFSFITASTIGYGDYYPTTDHGKALVVFQSVFCAVYVAVMMSIITSKLLWPTKSTIAFSKKILYDRARNKYQVRIINTNSMPIVNPEIRIAMTQHAHGDVLAGVLELNNRGANPNYLGRHDYVLDIGIDEVYLNNKRTKEADIIKRELTKALRYQEKAKKDDSRFRITLTFSGSNGVQNFAEIKKYYATDFVEGKGFKAIRYEGKDTNKLGIKYKRIPGFWKQFEAIDDE